MSVPATVDCLELRQASKQMCQPELLDTLNPLRGGSRETQRGLQYGFGCDDGVAITHGPWTGERSFSDEYEFATRAATELCVGLDPARKRMLLDASHLAPHGPDEGGKVLLAHLKRLRKIIAMKSLIVRYFFMCVAHIAG